MKNWCGIAERKGFQFRSTEFGLEAQTDLILRCGTLFFQFRSTEFGLEAQICSKTRPRLFLRTFNSVLRNLVLRRGIILHRNLECTVPFNSVLRNLVLRLDNLDFCKSFLYHFQFRSTEFGLEAKILIFDISTYTVLSIPFYGIWS